MCRALFVDQSEDAMMDAFRVFDQDDSGELTVPVSLPLALSLVLFSRLLLLVYFPLLLVVYCPLLLLVVVFLLSLSLAAAAGELDREEFEKMLPLLGEDVPAEDIGNWFDLVDLDQSGTIELDEFILLVKKMNSINDASEEPH